MSWEAGFGEEVEGGDVGREGAGMRMMILTWIWVDDVDRTGLSLFAWDEETSVSASDTLSADSGWISRKAGISTQDEARPKGIDWVGQLTRNSAHSDFFSSSPWPSPSPSLPDRDHGWEHSGYHETIQTSHILGFSPVSDVISGGSFEPLK